MASSSYYTVTHAVEGYTHSTATFARGGTHRYQLWRIWQPGPLCHFLMLNPSTADERQSDPTVTRCLNYAKAWSYGGLIVTNIFALRSTDPQQLYSNADPVGVDNDSFILDAQARCAVTVAAWGNHGKHMGRGEQVRALLEAPHMLGLNATGTPKHPLYLKADLQPMRWI